MRVKLIEDVEMPSSKDWRKALRAQPAYRIVNKTIRNQTQFILVVSVIGFIVLICLYLIPQKKASENSILRKSHYNSIYPLTKPIITNSLETFRIGIVADLDTESKSKSEKHLWFSYFMKGYLTYNPHKQTIVITWDRDSPIRLTGNYASKDRGMELSELVVFNGRLLTFEDRTGLVYEIVANKAIPWILLMDGNGNSTKGFKSEWATVKDETLYVGSMGKEWTSATGEFESHDPQYVKRVSVHGEVEHVNWVKEYKRIREVINIYWPGYMIHESGVWSKVHRKWFFLPRRCSNEPYNEVLDEYRGCSVLIIADEDFNNVQKINITNSKPTRGFSSFKFIPTSNDNVIVALRTEELNGNTSTYITVFTIKGEVLLDDLYLANQKYEGLEFI